MLSRLSLLLLLSNIYAFTALDLAGKEVIVEEYHFKLGTNVSNLSCEKSMSCISNTLSQKGGYYLDNNMLLLKWDDAFLCWTNFQLNGTIIIAYRENKIVSFEVK
jgi:hypothetical protein